MENFNSRLLQTFMFERLSKIRSGAYGFTQREMSFNSNKIEGSRLSKQQTSSLFDTGSIFANGEYRAKDIEEATGHFAMFNTMLDCIGLCLSEDMIKAYHKALKQGVFEDLANGYAVGGYKTRVNFVGVIETCHPSNVSSVMRNLLESYSLNQKTLSSLASFHVDYEKIHPFQDGNGRTGRMILFRECLLNNITPFIIRDCNKAQYINSLCLAQETGDISDLVSYFKKEQDWYYSKVRESII